jgi:hypothetical protein
MQVGAMNKAKLCHGFSSVLGCKLLFLNSIFIFSGKLNDFLAYVV